MRQRVVDIDIPPLELREQHCGGGLPRGQLGKCRRRFAVVRFRRMRGLHLAKAEAGPRKRQFVRF